MYGKLACFLLLAGAMLIHDIPKFNKAGRQERWAYIVMMAPLLYLGILFVSAKPWPNLDTLFDLFAPPARQIVRWLDPAST